jgi:hypothetical protein
VVPVPALYTSQILNFSVGSQEIFYAANGLTDIETCGMNQHGNSGPCRSSAVRRWLLTAAARVRVRAACGICGGQSGTGAVFLRASTSVSPANHSTDFSIIIITRGWHNRPLSARSVEWTLIPPPTVQIKKKHGNSSGVQLEGCTLLHESLFSLC